VRCASALAAKFADGKLIVVNAFDVKETKSKAFREVLDKLSRSMQRRCWWRVRGTENRNLELELRGTSMEWNW
jgi:ribosomal protein L4